MIGLVFFTWGCGSTIADIMLGIFSLKKAATPMTCEFWYYLVLLVIVIVGFVMYICVARWYKNRKRPEEDKDEVFYNKI